MIGSYVSGRFLNSMSTRYDDQKDHISPEGVNIEFAESLIYHSDMLSLAGLNCSL